MLIKQVLTATVNGRGYFQVESQLNDIHEILSSGCYPRNALGNNRMSPPDSNGALRHRLGGPRTCDCNFRLKLSNYWILIESILFLTVAHGEDAG